MAKILIVDDSETARSQLRASLAKAGHAVVEAFDGLNGIEVLAENPDAQLLICDVNMPRLDGLSLCARLRSMPQYSKLLMMILTTDTSPEQKTKGKAAGVTAWVTKPYVEDKLLAAIAKVLSMAK